MCGLLEHTKVQQACIRAKQMTVIQKTTRWECIQILCSVVLVSSVHRRLGHTVQLALQTAHSKEPRLAPRDCLCQNVKLPFPMPTKSPHSPRPPRPPASPLTPTAPLAQRTSARILQVNPPTVLNSPIAKPSHLAQFPTTLHPDLKPGSTFRPRSSLTAL